ncbi:hypothetical protein F4780DRAFT_290738 [Xylariomycetidae sp. FL0641]|nr:hypothetical protein F4780DRAFT_290738 [Xylariomycetidae sp. FL0641]
MPAYLLGLQGTRRLRQGSTPEIRSSTRVQFDWKYPARNRCPGDTGTSSKEKSKGRERRDQMAKVTFTKAMRYLALVALLVWLHRPESVTYCLFIFSSQRPVLPVSDGCSRGRVAVLGEGDEPNRHCALWRNFQLETESTGFNIRSVRSMSKPGPKVDRY